MAKAVVDKGNFAKGSIPKNILRLALPIILSELVHICYSAVDRMYIGHIPGYGTEALSGIGIVFPAITIIGAFANLFRVGGPTLCSIARGEHDDKTATLIMETTFTLTLLYGLVLTVIIYIFKKPIFFAFGADESTIGYVFQYGDIYFIGTVFAMITLAMNSFITLQGHGTIALVSTVIGAVLNIGLDPLFIYTFNFGLQGAAIATVISQFASALWITLYLSVGPIPIRLKKLTLDKNNVKRIHSLGVSGFAFKATNGVTQIAVNSTLKVFGGAASSFYIASMSIINQLHEMTMLAVSGVAEGAKSVISYNYGAKEYKRTLSSVKYMLLFALIVNSIGWMLMELCPEPIVRIFTSDPKLVSICVPALRIYYAGRLFMVLQTGPQNAFVALNHPKEAVFFALLRKIFLILPLTLILPRIGFGINGVFYAETVSEIVGSLCASTTFYFRVYKPIKNLMEAEGK